MLCACACVYARATGKGAHFGPHFGLAWPHLGRPEGGTLVPSPSPTSIALGAVLVCAQHEEVVLEGPSYEVSSTQAVVSKSPFLVCNGRNTKMKHPLPLQG